jgi:hypothetical protein
MGDGPSGFVKRLYNGWGAVRKRLIHSPTRALSFGPSSEAIAASGSETRS